jgi:hypothetical protein
MSFSVLGKYNDGMTVMTWPYWFLWGAGKERVLTRQASIFNLSSPQLSKRSVISVIRTELLEKMQLECMTEEFASAVIPPSLLP